MDKYSFLNAAHASYFAELYDRYLSSPDSVEPSWRAFFQGFDFGMESNVGEMPAIESQPTSLPRSHRAKGGRAQWPSERISGATIDRWL